MAPLSLKTKMTLVVSLLVAGLLPLLAFFAIDYFQQQFRQASHYLLLALVVVVCFSIAVVWVFMHYLTAPLLKLTRHVNEITDNEKFQAPIPLQTGDEIGTLALAFDWMLCEMEQQKLERRQAEEEIRQTLSLLNATLESTADGILVVDRGGKIVSYNQQFTRMWEIPEAVLLDGDDKVALDTVLRKLKDPASFLARVKELYHDPEAESHDTVEFMDGRVFERFSRPQRIEQAIVGRVWSFRDVTCEKKLEQQLRQAQKMEAFGTLAGGIAHDFNNIMTAIVGYGNLMKLDVDPASPLMHDLEQLLAAADKATSLTNGLLAYSRKEAIATRPVNLNEIVKKVDKLPPLTTVAVKAGDTVPVSLLRGGNETILLIEDNEEVRQLFREILVRRGYTVIEAVDGDDGIVKFIEHREDISLLIVDVIMPRKNGREVYDEIRRLKGDIKAIFTSGYTADIITRKGIVEGDLNFISKPLSPSKLLAKVRKVLDGSTCGEYVA